MEPENNDYLTAENAKNTKIRASEFGELHPQGETAVI
jgi:hypothetical protein